MWACLLTHFSFSRELYLYLSKHYASYAREYDKNCENELSRVTSRDLKWVALMDF